MACSSVQVYAVLKISGTVHILSAKKSNPNDSKHIGRTLKRHSCRLQTQSYEKILEKNYMCSLGNLCHISLRSTLRPPLAEQKKTIPKTKRKLNNLSTLNLGNKTDVKEV